MRSLEHRIPPALVAVAIAGLMFAVSRAAPGLAVQVPGRTTIALALTALGVALAFAGVMAFHAKRTTVNPLKPADSSSLVSGSVYRFTRNPMYLGMLLVLAGWAVYFANAAAAPLPLLFVLYMNRFQIRPEEKALRELFGAEAEAYMARVRRWL
jgi:protein-S-isoprenylcysteine O-methyltransferase Ste14